MKKKIGILLFGICTLVMGIHIGSTNGNFKNITKIPKSSGSMIAMYIQDEEGNYNLSDTQEFPKDGYVLNTEKSSCKNGGVISQNASTKALSLKVKTSDECTVYFDVVTTANPSADMLIAKANNANVTAYASGNKKEMFAFDHPEATQTTGWTSEERRDYRYIGNEPNNYITFNDETWRIIGVFTVETETGMKKPLMKIIRNESIGDIPWDDYTDGSSTNEWSTSSLQNLLNEEYYNTEGSFSYTYKTSSSYTAPAITIAKGLNSTARSQVAKVKWYLGNSNTYENLGGPDYYNFERGETTCVTTGNCSGETRTTNIMKNVGLMYPSDYVYTYANGVDNKCYTDGHKCDNYYGAIPSAGWLYNNAYQLTVSPGATSVDYSVLLYSSGMVYSSYDSAVYAARGVRPVVFLNSNVRITDGDGSQGNPYAIGAKN